MGPAGDSGSLSSRERPGFCPRFFVEHEPPCSGEPVADLAPGADVASGVYSLLGTDVVLGAEDSRHALKVLRVGQGDCFEVVTPAGQVYAAVVSVATDPVHVKPVARLEGAAAGAVYRTQVGLVQALARPSVMDHVIEKGTEVGAGFFLLVPAAGSARLSEEAKADRLVRWRRIAREAAKQSKQTAVPWVDVAESVGDGLSRMAGSGTLTVILEPGAPGPLQQVLRAAFARREPSRGGPDVDLPTGVSLPPRVSLWVGPEGGWTEAELGLFLAAGTPMARLGQSILRTETAGPVAVAVARLELGDW
jgi:16S rRNA (uracil1498-N3)-methyltransferase